MNGNPWTKEEEELIRRTYHTHSAADLVPLLPGRSKQAILTKTSRLKLGGKPYSKRDWMLMPVGMEHENNLGYVKIKIAPDKWRLKQTVVWEAAHGRKARGVIRFRDGNKRNFDIANLEEVSRKENMARNSVSNLPQETRVGLS